MINLEDIPSVLADLTDRVDKIRQSLDVPGKSAALGALEKQMAQQNFWDNSESAQKTVEKLKVIKSMLDPLEKVHSQMQEMNLLWELAEQENDTETRQDVAESLEKLQNAVAKVELGSLLSGENDSFGCFFSIHAGAGGTESCDWANMLLRMYTRYFDRSGYRYEEISLTPGEEAGIRSITLRVSGPYAFGYLSCETGVHRLVRISPFDSNKRRHTSFAAVDVLVDHGESTEVEIAPDDIDMEFYCKASGAGGQNVNKVASAVRIRHNPTGIVVDCVSQRSQHQNRALALALLKAKIERLEQKKRDDDMAKLYGEKGEIAWGNQIRSYVMQPYQMVKDHRTDYQMGNPQTVLDGELDDFIAAYLRHRASQK